MFPKRPLGGPNPPFGKALLAFVMATMLAGPGTAVQSMLVPNFNVLNPDGSSAKSSDWALQGKWLMIYVEGECPPCMKLLGNLTKQNFPNLAGQLIIIGGGMHPAEVQALQKRFPDLSGAMWFADPPKNAGASLKLRGAPVTLGIRDRNIEWGVSGIPADPNLLPSVLKKWSTQ